MNAIHRQRLILLLATALVLGGCGSGGSSSNAEGDAGQGTGDSTIDTGMTGQEEDATAPSTEDGGHTDSGRVENPTAPVGEGPLRRLTQVQYRNTIKALVGVDVDEVTLPADGAVGPFTSNATTPISQVQIDQYAVAAQTVAQWAVADLEQLLPCAPDEVGENICAEQFIATFVPRAWRRPISSTQRERLFAIYGLGRENDDFQHGMQLLLEAIFQSPYFIYHVEIGTPAAHGRIALTDHEVAARLSYLFWNAPPDDDLWRAAEGGGLSTAADIRAMAERMLTDERSATMIATFHVEWLNLTELDRLDKDTERYPIFNAEVREAMKRETMTFVDHVIRRGDGRLETLMSAPYSFVEGPLFAIYGMVEPPDHDPTRPVALDPAQRAGVLTHASVMAAHGRQVLTDPVHRGLLVYQNIMCRALGAPPADVDITPVEVDPDSGLTRRETFAQHVSDPNCSGCHSIIDPLGFAFEHYDAMGAYRTTDLLEGRPVDAAAQVLTGTDVDGSFTHGLELIQRLATSDTVRRCVARQWTTFALGRTVAADDEDELEAVHQAFAEEDYNIRTLLLAIVSQEMFRVRAAPTTAEEEEP